MVLVQILKRKDGASLIVGVAMAAVLGQLLPTLTGNLASRLSGLDESQYGFSGQGWQTTYLKPVVWAILQVILLELLARLYIILFASSKKK